MFVRVALIVALCVGGCRRDEPLERLAATGARTLDPSPFPKPPPPPPPPVVRQMPAPPPIAALVVDRFGTPTITLTFGRRSRVLSPAQAAHLVERLARDDGFFDGMNGCTCGGVGVRIARGAEHVDFTVDCGNVYLGEVHVGTLADDVVEYIDSLL